VLTGFIRAALNTLNPTVTIAITNITPADITMVTTEGDK
jgi:hypothetical protein